MARKEHVAHVPYARLADACRESGGWTCAACGGEVQYKGLGHSPEPRVPLFTCAQCGRRSDGCQTFEGHHLLYSECALEGDASSRCGYWLGDWEYASGVCPVCGSARRGRARSAATRGAGSLPGPQTR